MRSGSGRNESDDLDKIIMMMKMKMKGNLMISDDYE